MDSRAQDAPRNLHSTQYAAWILENTIGMPASKSNLQIVSDSIDAIAKSKFRDEKWKHPVFTAFIWLNRKCEHAQMRKIPTSHLFFLNGEYLQVPDPQPKIAEFVPCAKCINGWVYTEPKDNMRRVRPCECRTQWVASAKERP